MEVDAALAKLKPRIDGLARVGRALRVGRLETAAADVLRQLWRAELLGSELMIVGSAAIHLYEATAGVLAPQAILPEGTSILPSSASGVEEDDLLRILRRADKTFRRGVRELPLPMRTASGSS